MCSNFIHEWRYLQFKVGSERQIFQKFSMAILFTLRVFARNLMSGSPRRYIFIFSFWCLTWGLKSDLTSNTLHIRLQICSLQFYKQCGLRPSFSTPLMLLVLLVSRNERIYSLVRFFYGTSPCKFILLTELLSEICWKVWTATLLLAIVTSSLLDYSDLAPPCHL